MHELAEGYNPNYQDMAVKAAVVGYQESFVDAAAAQVEGEVEAPPQQDEAAELQAELDQLDRVDLTALAMSFDDSSPASEEEGEGARESPFGFCA